MRPLRYVMVDAQEGRVISMAETAALAAALSRSLEREQAIGAVYKREFERHTELYNSVRKALGAFYTHSLVADVVHVVGLARNAIG